MAIIPNFKPTVELDTIQKAAATAAAQANQAVASAAEAAAQAAAAATFVAGAEESASEAAASATSAQAAVTAAQAAESNTARLYSEFSGWYGESQESYSQAQENYSDFQEKYSTLSPAWEVLTDYAIVQETATAEENPDSFISQYIHDVASAAFDSRGNSVIACGSYTGAYSTFDNEPYFGNGRGFPQAYLKEMDIFRHEVTESYTSLSYSAISVKPYATAEIWLELPITDTGEGFTGSISWPYGQWLETDPPDTLELGKGHVFIVRNVGLGPGTNQLILNYAYTYSLPQH